MRELKLSVFIWALLAGAVSCQQSSEGSFDLDTSAHEFLVDWDLPVGYVGHGMFSIQQPNHGEPTGTNWERNNGQNATFWDQSRYIAASNRYIQIRDIKSHEVLKIIDENPDGIPPKDFFLEISNIVENKFYYIKNYILFRYDLETFKTQKIADMRIVVGSEDYVGANVPRLFYSQDGRSLGLIYNYDSFIMIDLRTMKTTSTLPAKRLYFDPTDSAAVYLLNSNEHEIFRFDLNSGKKDLVLSSKDEIVDFAKFGPSIFVYKFMGKTFLFNNWIWRWNVYSDGKFSLVVSKDLHQTIDFKDMDHNIQDLGILDIR